MVEKAIAERTRSREIIVEEEEGGKPKEKGAVLYGRTITRLK